MDQERTPPVTSAEKDRVLLVQMGIALLWLVGKRNQDYIDPVGTTIEGMLADALTLVEKDWMEVHDGRLRGGTL